jgi:hypothetical protein
LETVVVESDRKLLAADTLLAEPAVALVDLELSLTVLALAVAIGRFSVVTGKTRKFSPV